MLKKLAKILFILLQYYWYNLLSLKCYFSKWRDSSQVNITAGERPKKIKFHNYNGWSVIEYSLLSEVQLCRITRLKVCTFKNLDIFFLLNLNTLTLHFIWTYKTIVRSCRISTKWRGFWYWNKFNFKLFSNIIFRD